MTGKARSPFLAGRIVAAVLILAPLLVWLTIVIAALGMHARPVATGDKLLDRYLQELVNRGLVLPPPADTSQKPMLLDDSVIAVWEPEFGNDPRYWQLRFLAARDPENKTVSPVAKVAVNANYCYLEEARRRGVADCRTLYFLLTAYDMAWNGESIRSLGQRAPTYSKDPAGHLAFVKAIRRETDRLHGGETDKLLAEIHAASEPDAQALFGAAAIECERGHAEQAAADLNQCSALTNVEWALPFPFDELRRKMYRGVPVCGDKLLTGALCSKEGVLAGTEIPCFIQGKSALRSLLYDALLRGDMRTLGELHNYTCRLGCASNATVMESLVAEIMTDAIATSAASTHPPPSGTSAAQALSKVCAMRVRMSQQFQAIIKPGPPAFLSNPQDWRNLPGLLLLVVANGRGPEAVRMAEMYSYSDSEERELVKRIPPLFHELERFDYETMSWK